MSKDRFKMVNSVIGDWGMENREWNNLLKNRCPDSNRGEEGMGENPVPGNLSITVSLNDVTGHAGVDDSRGPGHFKSFIKRSQKSGPNIIKPAMNIVVPASIAMRATPSP
jgi:hypothetical protein